MLSLSDNNQAEFILAFNSTDDLLNIDYPYSEQMASLIYCNEFQSNGQISLIRKLTHWDVSYYTRWFWTTSRYRFRTKLL